MNVLVYTGSYKSAPDESIFHNQVAHGHQTCKYGDLGRAPNHKVF